MTVAESAGFQFRIDDRVEHDLCGCLRHPVHDAGNKQYPFLAVGLEHYEFQQRTGFIGSSQHRLRKRAQVFLQPERVILDRLTVISRTPVVRRNPVPRPIDRFGESDLIVEPAHYYNGDS